MHLRTLFLGILLALISFSGSSQGFWFGLKAGPTLAFQQWNNLDRSALISGHYAAFLESHSNNEDASGSLVAQLGMHRRGSALRYQQFFTGNNYSQNFQFNNASLMLGVKRFLKTDADPYYLVGVRVEYTVSTNLLSIEDANNIFFPVKEYVNKFNYGMTVGGGFNFSFSEFVGGFLELTLHPDLSNQYDQPPLGNIPNPFTGGQTNVAQRQIKNLSFEITAGIRFLRKVIYID